MLVQGLSLAAGLLLLAFHGVDAGYAPIHTSCPATPLVRPATGLSADEAAFRQSRKPLADEALKNWLAKTNSAFNTTGTLPTLALSVSGGGYRSLLVGAGLIQGLDDRDSNIGTSGLYQALTYQSGLSGGGWLLSSIAGNDHPTITTLKEELWKQAFQDSLLVPDHLLVAVAYSHIVNDLTGKHLVGFPPTLTDPWGRLLSYQLLEGPNGGVDTRFSSVQALPGFTSHEVPFPIILALGVKTFDGECGPGPNATTYEFTPFEFGSWDSDVSAFARMDYLGTSMSNGQPAQADSCVTNYDNLGYVLGTSSSLFNEVCPETPIPRNSSTELNEDLAEMLKSTHEISTRDLYAVYPNPFYNYQSSTAVPNPANPIWEQEELSLVDGGLALQNNPIWPFLQPARAVDVLLVNDNSADDPDNFPNGTEILTTYVQSFNHGLARMPYIPPVDTFVAHRLNKQPTFFGCYEPDRLTVVYIPNVNFTYASNQPTAKVQYFPDETDAMIANGLAMADQGGEAGWPTCLGCAIMAKTGTALPGECDACFEKHCYKP